MGFWNDFVQGLQDGFGSMGKEIQRITGTQSDVDKAKEKTENEKRRQHINDVAEGKKPSAINDVIVPEIDQKTGNIIMWVILGVLAVVVIRN